ncbi:GGDEF domain-containing protein [Sphingomonas desiccabilis]|nr:GGDEF domain-containing protein [Sphingomonas desiccabilis]MBB3911475.1 diguanylate cyclase (GGDEF)-like protein [Sphingomonas desiccabilis]
MRRTLLHSLYASLPIFAGGVLNTVAVSALVAARMHTTAAYIWVALEVLLAAARLPALVLGRKAIAEGRRGPTDVYILLAVLWAASVGYGTFMCVASGDWVAAALACLSAAAMVGGICFRNFGAPRLVAVMIGLSLGPCAIAAAFSGQPVLLLVMFQIPFYLISMSAAAFQLNRLLVRTMRAEMINDHHARHDPLTGLLNRGGLARWAAEQAGRGNGSLAVFYLDLDWFKSINDTMGHKAGDTVLVGVAERLQQLAVGRGQVARLGGDEFVLVADDLDRDGADALKERMCAAIADRAYLVEGRQVHVGASVGVARSEEHGDDLAILLEVADLALHDAKSNGRVASGTSRVRDGGPVAFRDTGPSFAAPRVN